jgi:hypothetical protein
MFVVTVAYEEKGVSLHIRSVISIIVVAFVAREASAQALAALTGMKSTMKAYSSKKAEANKKRKFLQLESFSLQATGVFVGFNVLCFIYCHDNV